MVRSRIVVGAVGDDVVARRAARRLRDEGHEVVFVGGAQTPEQLVRTAVAEDATRIIVEGDERSLEAVVQLCRDFGVDHIEVGDAV